MDPDKPRDFGDVCGHNPVWCSEVTGQGDKWRGKNAVRVADRDADPDLANVDAEPDSRFEGHGDPFVVCHSLRPDAANGARTGRASGSTERSRTVLNNRHLHGADQRGDVGGRHATALR